MHSHDARDLATLPTKLTTLPIAAAIDPADALLSCGAAPVSGLWVTRNRGAREFTANSVLGGVMDDRSYAITGGSGTRRTRNRSQSQNTLKHRDRTPASRHSSEE